LNPNDQAIIQAYLDSLFWKFQNESTAKIIDIEDVKGIQYIQPLNQAWPRRFQYQMEFFSGESSPNLVFDRINKYCNQMPGEYLLNILSSNVNVLIPKYKDLGYLHAWNNAILLHKLTSKEKNVEKSESVLISEVKTMQEIANVNALGPEFPLSLSGLADSCTFNFYASYAGEIGAMGQAIIVNPKYIYIADMYTHPDFRRKGLSAALLFKFHQIGLEKGCNYSILLPSKMTRNIELFQKFSYFETVSIALLVPEISPLKQFIP